MAGVVSAKAGDLKKRSKQWQAKKNKRQAHRNCVLPFESANFKQLIRFYQNGNTPHCPDPVHSGHKKPGVNSPCFLGATLCNNIKR